MAYLVARGHSAKLVKSEFDRMSSIPVSAFATYLVLLNAPFH